MGASRKKGFSLLEVMVAVGILGVLATMATSWYNSSKLRAQRTEAVIALEGIQISQFAYYADRSEFATTFDDLDFRPNGARATGTTHSGRTYTYTLSQPWGSRSWYCSGSADLDGDTWPDMLVAYERL